MIRNATLACAGLLWFAVLPALAEPVGLTYGNPSNEILLPDGATGGFSFPNTASSAVPADGGVVATRLVAWSVAPEDAPDRVSNLPYQFAVEFGDLSGETARVSFAGTLSGSFWRTGAALTNRFTGPTTRTAEVGGSRVTVDLTGFVSPTGYGEEFAGSITARVTLGADPVPVPGPEVPEPAPPAPPTATPEPATFALVLPGLLALAARRLGRHRRLTRRPMSSGAVADAAGEGTARPVGAVRVPGHRPASGTVGGSDQSPALRNRSRRAFWPAAPIPSPSAK